MQQPDFHIFNESSLAVEPSTSNVVALFKRMCEDHALEPGWINVVILPNDEHTDLNIKYLSHDYDTDVLTFEFNEEATVNGEIYINGEVCATNAQAFNASPTEELHRLIVHGLLHLLGHDDQTEEERESMRKLEDKYLATFHVKP